MSQEVGEKTRKIHVMTMGILFQVMPQKNRDVNTMNSSHTTLSSMMFFDEMLHVHISNVVGQFYTRNRYIKKICCP